MRGSRGGGGYLPPESLFFPVCDISQSESGGWCLLTPTPHSSPLDTSQTRRSKVSRPCITLGLGEGDWWPPIEFPNSSHSGPGGVAPATPPAILPRTLVTLPAPTVYPVRRLPPPSSAVCNPPLSVCPPFNRDYVPSPPSY